MKKLVKSITLLAILGSLITANAPPISFAGPPPQDGGDVRSVVHDQTGYLSFIGIDSNRAGMALPGATRTSGVPTPATALADLTVYGARFGLRSPAEELRFIKSGGPRGGGTSFRYQQVYQGIPVIAGELIASYDMRGRLVAIVGEIAPGLTVNTTPTVDPARAMTLAVQVVSKETGVPVSDLTATSPELWIYDPRLLSPSTFPAQLVWRMEVKPTRLLPINYLVLVNASLGGVTLAFNQVDTFWGEQAARHSPADQPAPDSEAILPQPPALPNFPNPSGATYDSHGSEDLAGDGASDLVCNTPPTALNGAGSCDGTSASPPSRANAAHYFAYNTFSYFDLKHQRNSINNAGLPLISNINYSEDYFNAFWDGTQMVYGNADFLETDDVVAHELSHGVTQYESDLFYYYESGAINEMFSDIFGEFTDQWNGVNRFGGADAAGQKWKIGEDMNIGALRNMANPPSGDPPQPDRTQSSLYFTGFQDNGGVHYNSGVGNKAAYLMAVGGSFNGKTITALGNDKTSAIFYEVQTNLLTSGADYNMLGAALVQACHNLRTGSNPLGVTAADCTETNEAVQATEMHLDPVANREFAPQASLCPNSSTVPVNHLFNDNIEGGLGNFTVGTLINNSSMPSSFAWVETSTVGGLDHYATSGTKSLFGVNYPDIYGFLTFGNYQSYIQFKNPISIPAGSTYYLHFNHAVALEDPTAPYDGGVLEYSINGGSSWQDASPFFQAGKNYDGTVINLFNNPLGGRRAFTRESHGFVSSRYNLSALAGNNVIFRWVIGADVSVGWLGWFLDDIQVYQCGTAPLLPAPILLTPANNTITRVTTPTFSWGTVTGANRFRLQVDNDADFSSPVLNVTPSGTTYTYKPTTPLTSGVYYWRVQARNVSNLWGAWSTVWTLTIDTIKPGKPTLLSPPTNTTVTDSTPLFDWSDATDAHHYEFQTDNNSDFSSPVLTNVSSNAASNFTPSTAMTDGVYYWRVRTYDLAGNKSGWSTAFKLRVDAVPTPIPSLISPADGSTTTDATPTFTWTAGTGVKKFKLQVDDNADFSSPAINVTTAATAYTPTTALPKNVIYYWRVQAQGVDNLWGAWSSVNQVHIVKTLAPELPVESLPFTETFDSGQRWTPAGQWQLDRQLAHSGSGWFVEAMTRNRTSTITAEFLLDLTTARAPQLSFWQKLVLTSGDAAAVDISIDGGQSWLPLNVQVGVTEDWALHTVDLSLYRGGVIRLRFRLDTFGVVPPGATSFGWWIDDLSVMDAPPALDGAAAQ